MNPTSPPQGTAPTPQRASMSARPWRGIVPQLTQWLSDRTGAVAWWPGTSEGRLAWPVVGSWRAPFASTDLPWQAPLPWEQAATERRTLLLQSVALGSALATLLILPAQPFEAAPLASTVYVLMFALLFAWIMAGFVTALMGLHALRHGDRHALRSASLSPRSGDPIDPHARTAIIMPIRHESVASVFAGLQAVAESLASRQEAGLFDVYVLSDSSDPDVRVAELASFAAWRQAVARTDPALASRLYYRWRQRRTHRKAGNVADFCRRWGRRYRYMVVLDADSVMSGDALVTLVRLMEANPDAGIIQTTPQPCGQHTVHARAQQFAARITGRLFTLGMQHWQLGDAHYWGHNAILRVAPFMQHCALAPLPGRGGLSGGILSHDFVEAALMRRAGFHVWMVSDISGSHEQVPPNLVEELRRDRRWCQGNLQNLRLIAEPGLHPAHRVMLLTGAMAYLSAPLWLGFVLLGLWLNLGVPGAAVGEGAAWCARMLWGVMVALLLLPRVLGAWAAASSDERRRLGGGALLARGVALEMLLSALYAPIRMVAHTGFVLTALTGWAIEWRSPPRDAQAVPRRLAWQVFWPGAVAGLGVTAALAWWEPSSLPVVLPLAVPLMLAAPLAVWTSRVDAGQRLREAGWLVTPEERWAPAVLNRAWSLASGPWPTPGWLDLLRDPALLAQVVSLSARQKTSGLRSATRRLWVAQAMAQGPQALDDGQRLHLLNEPRHLLPLAAADAECGCVGDA